MDVPDRFPVNFFRSGEAADAGVELISYATFDEAAADPDAAVILSGEYGTTSYLTVPLGWVCCDSDTLWLLLSDIDATWWMGGTLDWITNVAVERRPVGSVFWTPDGETPVLDGVWTLSRLAPVVREQAVDVVRGRRARIDLHVLRAVRDAELARVKASRLARGLSGEEWDVDIHPPYYPFIASSGSGRG